MHSLLSRGDARSFDTSWCKSVASGWFQGTFAVTRTNERDRTRRMGWDTTGIKRCSGACSYRKSPRMVRLHKQGSRSDCRWPPWERCWLSPG